MVENRIANTLSGPTPPTAYGRHQGLHRMIPQIRTTTSHAHNGGIRILNKGAYHIALTCLYHSPSYSGRIIHSLPRQERQIFSTHELWHLTRGPDGIRNARHPHQPRKNTPQYLHHNQRSDQAIDHHHQPHNPYPEHTRTHLLAALDDPRHNPARRQHAHPLL